MSQLPPFESFGKIARYNRIVTVTEKIDGTNAQIYISPDGLNLVAGSRNRYVTPANDNFGFARWCEDHKDELLALGPGRHFGEWWGKGIQRGYGLPDKRFSLFNTSQWTEDTTPPCCHVVPILFHGLADDLDPTFLMRALAFDGSKAAPGYKNPEGIIMYHEAARTYFKMTYKDEHKGKA